MIRYLLVLFMLATTAARAQLGQSISDCDIKFNAGRKATSSAMDKVDPLASGPGTTNYTYIYKGYTLRIGFRDGKATCVDYNRTGTQKLTEKEIDAVLEDNAGETPWEDAPVEFVRQTIPVLRPVIASDGKARTWVSGKRAGAVLYNLGRSIRLAERPPKKPGR